MSHYGMRSTHRPCSDQRGGIRRGLKVAPVYYDTAGALRDMVQNHISSFFALLPMEVLRHGFRSCPR